jgi:hypothetical protein
MKCGEVKCSRDARATVTSEPENRHDLPSVADPEAIHMSEKSPSRTLAPTAYRPNPAFWAIDPL